jgi:hypothetical protein
MWGQDMTPQEIEAAYRSPSVDRLRLLMADFYTPEEFGMWLALPHPQIGKSALEMIHEGRGDEILRVAQQLSDGVYI